MAQVLMKGGTDERTNGRKEKNEGRRDGGLNSLIRHLRAAATPLT